MLTLAELKTRVENINTELAAMRKARDKLRVRKHRYLKLIDNYTQMKIDLEIKND
jgi:hypothetical protein